MWLRGLRCGSVLVEVLGIKSASRPFGLEQVRLLTPSTSTREGRSYADPAQRYELHQGIPSARVVSVGSVGPGGWAVLEIVAWFGRLPACGADTGLLGAIGRTTCYRR